MPNPPVITSIDIINLSHALKDICEVQDKTQKCLNEPLKVLMQYNLIKLNLIFERQLQVAYQNSLICECEDSLKPKKSDCQDSSNN